MSEYYNPIELAIDAAYYNKLDIHSFMLMLKDPSYCYKFYWLEAIVKPAGNRRRTGSGQSASRN